MHINQTSMQPNAPVTGIPYKQTGRFNLISKITGVLFLIITATIILVIGIPMIREDTVAITFTLDAPYAKSVALVGDFNKWDPNVHPLKQKNGIWATTIRLKKGNIYTYNFLLDAAEMITDPQSQSIDDGYGGESSIIEIK